MSNTIRLATRSSVLALWQANRITDLLRLRHPEITVELIPMTTTPDRRPDASLAELSGDKGLFVRELEDALLTGKADAAIHSLKDVPVQGVPSELQLVAFPERAPAHDVWISRDGSSITEIASGSIIGTSALRRQGQLLHLRPDLTTKPIRGNVPNRIQKLRDGEYDAIILAAAGIERLDLTREITEHIPVTTILNAAGQGILALESRKDSPWNPILASLDDPLVRQCAEMERLFNYTLGADCHSATACLAQITDESLTFVGRVISPDGRDFLEIPLSQPFTSSTDAAVAAAHSLIDRGALSILKNEFPR